LDKISFAPTSKDFTPSPNKRWSTSWKKALLAILEKLHRCYMDELKLEAAVYRDIRTYFVKLTGSVDEAAPSAQPPG
jgi:hypothetical protein